MWVLFFEALVVFENVVVTSSYLTKVEVEFFFICKIVYFLIKYIFFLLISQVSPITSCVLPAAKFAEVGLIKTC